jgi:hypothetical protein
LQEILQELFYVSESIARILARIHFRAILTVHVDADGGRVRQNSKDAVTRLEKEIAEALATLELTMPAIFFHSQAHILLHVPQAVQKWGSVRNFWAFSMERFVQHMFLALFLA